MFRQNPAFTLIALLSLTLGIGANTAVFSLVDAVMLRALPVRAPRELVYLGRNPERIEPGFNYPDYRYIRDHNTVFQDVAAHSFGGPAVGFQVPGGRTEVIAGQFVSGNYFSMLGVTAEAGRLLAPADDVVADEHAVAVLSYGFWQSRFQGSSDVIGKTIRLNAATLTIVGVARRGFSGAETGVQPAVFMPIAMLPRILADSAESWNTRNYWWLYALARLKPGVTIPQATAALEVLYAEIRSNPNKRPSDIDIRPWKVNETAAILPASQGFSYMRQTIAKPLLLLQAVVGLVLLIACTNVANLLLAKAAARKREIAIRLAMGASRAQIAKQLLTEGMLLAAAGAGLGLVFAFWGVRVLVGFMPRSMFALPFQLEPDPRLLAFSCGISLSVGLVFGLAPAWGMTRPDVIAALKNDAGGSVFLRAGFGRVGTRRILIVVQIAMSLLLLVGAGLFTETLAKLRQLDPGFARGHVLVVTLDPTEQGYSQQRARQFLDRLREGVQHLPGVLNASFASNTPLSGGRWIERAAVQGTEWKSGKVGTLDMNAVSDQYFPTMGIPILLGRDFRAADEAAFLRGGGAPRVAIINETMAKRFYGNESPLGRRISTGQTTYEPNQSIEIVGVVADVRYRGLRKEAGSMVYVPALRGGPWMNLCLRSAGDPKQLAGLIRGEVQKLDGTVPIKTMRTMDEEYDNDIVRERMFATLCSFFAVLALVLSAVGLYGVMAQAVTRRTREIGIRMALGARRAAVLRMVLRETLMLIALGIAIGIPAVLVVTRFVSAFLYGLTPNDPWVIGGATATLAAITLLAGYVPARRASLVEPTIALRHD